MSMMPTVSATEQPVRILAPDPVEPQSDFDLHGLVGIRLIDASPAESSAVGVQLGLHQRPLDREPDITVRFVDRLPVSTPMHLLGLSDAGYTGDAFVLLRGKHKTPVKVQIPFDRIGGHCEIVCERGIPAVPLLIAIVNLTALARGGLAMHASAFRYAGTDVLVTGWSKGGKTEVLLGFTANGAQYIGDEWIYVDSDRDRVFGIPEPIRVWDWHLRQMPRYWRGLRRSQRLKLSSLRYLTAALSSVASAAGAQAGGWQRGVGRVVELLERQRFTHLAPRQTFGKQFGPLEGAIRKVVFVASHDAADTTVERIEPEEVAERMVFSLEEERAGLMSYYRMFRFAFPGKINPLLETASEIEGERLRSFLQDKECFAVYHPYPPLILDLFEAVRPIVEG
jgi:hypothetical protein